MSGKDLHFFMAHLDDFELSCIAYLWRKSGDYENIVISVATEWEPKTQVWKENYETICGTLNLTNVKYINHQLGQRSLMTNFDTLKDSFYKTIDFSKRFDIVTHDNEDCHTDHIACNMIAGGLYKYTNKFVTVYSPSSKNFKANYWIGMSNGVYDLKKKCVDKYNTSNEQSYTRLGYYIQSESHYNLGKAYYLENFVHQDFEHYETYRVMKDIE